MWVIRLLPIWLGSRRTNVPRRCQTAKTGLGGSARRRALEGTLPWDLSVAIHVSCKLHGSVVHFRLLAKTTFVSNQEHLKIKTNFQVFLIGFIKLIVLGCECTKISPLLLFRFKYIQINREICLNYSIKIVQSQTYSNLAFDISFQRSKTAVTAFKHRLRLLA